jgi:NitT/TauT family transport system substrate-binding protein
MQAIVVILVIVIAALGGYIAYSMTQKSTSTTNIILQLDWIPSGAHLYIYAAEDLYWQNLGLSVTVVRGTGSGDAMVKTGDGVADFGVGTFDAGVNVRATQSLLVKAIFNVVSASDMGYFWIERDNGRGMIDKNNLTTLEGKVFAEPVYGAGHAQSPAFAKVANFNWSKVDYVSMDPGATVSALIAGTVDFVSPGLGEQYVYQQQVRSALGDAVANQCQWIFFKDYGFKMLGDTVWTSDRMILDHPDVVGKFVQGLQQGFKYSMENITGAISSFDKFLPEFVGFENQTKAEFLGRFDGVINMTEQQTYGCGYMNPTVVAGAVTNTYSMYGITSDRYLSSPTEAYTNQFLQASIYPTSTPPGWT